MQAGILCILNAKQFKIDVRFVSVSETQIQPDACRLIWTTCKFQDFPGPQTINSTSFQDQTHFPGLSGSWKC